jgi:superfamily II RNA helicase
MPQSLATEFKFPLDPFQQHAIAAISRDENVLVTAKTGSGKTLVGEYQIAHSLAKGRRVFYTTPIKSLSNQKFHDLKSQFPSVGIMTGDLKFRPDADVVIMTTEILRNLLFKQDSAATRNLGITASLSLDRLDAVVFDECHYINDRDRGAVWEETMILLPPHVNLVLLSATIEGPELFAGWLGDLKQKPIHLISTQYRIVPLQHGVYRGDELLTVMDSKDRFEGGLYNAWLLWRKGQVKAADQHKARVADRRRGGYEDGPVARAGGQKAYKHQLNELVSKLEEKELLPALVFVFSRKDCERYAANMECTLLDSSDVASVKHIVDFHLHRYGDALQRLPQYQTLRALLERGIAFHHSGLLPVLKEMVEILFGRGFIKLLFATETFAVGINMPTKTVIFTGYRKYDDGTGGMRMLNTDEYIQMAGRAGRRGKDDRGLVLYLPDREPESLDDVKRMMTGARATFQSRMTFHYDFLLKTLQSGNLDWLYLLRQSYWYKRHEQMVAGCHKQIVGLEKTLESLAIGPTERAELEERDRLAARLKETTNAARREAQKEWGVWENRHVGPRWLTLVKETWPRWKSLTGELAELRADVAAMEDPSRGVWPSFAALARMGLLEEPVVEGEPLRLTALGTAATEVNEGHPVLMTLAYHRGVFKGLPVEQVVACLAAFLGEGGADAPVLGALSVPEEILTTLQSVERIAAECETAEVSAQAARAPRDDYWQLNTTWVEPVWSWMAQEADTVELCARHGFYEGNLMRTLLKMANLVEELRSIATLAADVDMLETLRECEKVLVRGVAASASDSLYLRV